MQPGVVTFALAGWVDPAIAFATLFGGRDGSVWLDSGIEAETGWSFMAEAALVRSASGIAAASLLDEVEADLAARKTEPINGFPLGWVGWLGYELREFTMGARPSSEPALESRHPDVAFARVDRLVAFDHATRSVHLVALGESWTGDLASWRNDVIDLLAKPRHPQLLEPCAEPVSWRYSDERYLEMIRSCQASITEGDAYQLCLTTEARVDVAPDPLATYLAVRASSPSHHGAFVRLAGVSLLSASPEKFLAVSPGGVVESSPIKGTRPRGSTPASDNALAAELLDSDKERAENLMIVDLMRNDIGRIAEIGSVSVPRLLEVETYAHVHQLVSTVSGVLAAGTSGMDAVRSCFPAGSMTGAPKRRATELLAALEARPRGLYSGAFGLFSLDGTIDLAMTIRSIVLDGESATVGTGGGITALSVPNEELEETKLKARALLAVLTTEV